jgi:hypothetical protein
MFAFFLVHMNVEFVDMSSKMLNPACINFNNITNYHIIHYTRPNTKIGTV